LTIFRGNRLGPEYDGNAFVCESLTNLVTRRILKPDGPTFRSVRDDRERDREFLASADRWTHPVFLTTGPDGCLYFADFYREFVEHPQYVADKKARESVDFRHGAEHGRIWRIRRKSMHVSSEDRRPRLENANIEALCQAMTHPVGWWRDTAQRLLIERQARSAAPQLTQLTRTATLAQSRLQAAWTLEGLGLLNDDTIARLVQDPEPRVRRSALKLAERRIAKTEMVRREVIARTDDPDRGVRFELVLILNSLDSPAATDALILLLQEGQDEWIDRAVLCGATQVLSSLATILLGKPGWTSGDAETRTSFLERLGRQIGAKGDALSLKAILDGSHPATDSENGTLAFIAGFVHSTSGARVIQSLADVPAVASILNRAKATAQNQSATDRTRVLAIDLLAVTRNTGSDQIFVSLLAEPNSSVIQAAAAKSLLRSEDETFCREVFDRWTNFTTRVRREILSAATASPISSLSLLHAIEKGQVSPTEIMAGTRDELMRNSRKEIADRASTLLGTTSAKDRQTVVDAYRSVLEKKGDPVRGGALFKEHCAVCHAIQGVGQRIGPDLAAVGSRRNDILLVDILDPSRQVSSDFLGYIVSTKQGRVLSGLVAAENKENLTIRREGGSEETIPRSELEDIQPTGKSLMPDGFEQKLTHQQFADVLEFLRRPDPNLLRERGPARSR
jgi:putative heme-binding domain-containing protein